MSWIKEHPRLVAIGTAGLGAIVILFIVSIGGMEIGGRGGGKAAFLIGIGGIALGVGLMQVIWPPVREDGDDRTAFGRASWPQRLLWILGGMAGIVAAAVAQTMASGKI